MPSKHDLLAAIHADRNGLVHFLQSLISAPSPNPPGDTTAVAQVIVEFLSQYGVHTDVITASDNMPNVVSVLNEPAPGPCLVMNPHIDVFPVSDDGEWKHGPWSGDIENGRIYGRGVVDMKAGTAAQVAAFAHLRRLLGSDLLNKICNRKCALVAVSDEETGGRWGSRYLLDHDARKDIWRGDVVLNAEPTGLQSIRFAEKGTLRLTFTVRTKSAHGAYVHLSEGAIRIATRLITRLLALESFTGFDLDPDLRAHLADEDVHHGTRRCGNMLRPTVNIGTIRGGDKVNTIPGLCVFETDIRLPIGLTADIALAQIHKILDDFPGAGVKVQEAASNPPNFCSPEHEIVRAVQRNAEAVLGGKEKKGRTPLAIPSMGATDCKFWRYRGVPAYSYGLSPDGMAGRDESVNVEDYIKLVKIQAGTVWDWLTEQEGNEEES
ncbi:hypothetical protein H2203_008222 [Taxawa tesnikishii (nom. ined.)]|nr:hypothetical protein H2203_008222 [Dothideales sp. JES 119]